MRFAKIPHLLFFMPLLFSIVSCASNEIGQSKDVNQEAIYQEYDIVYDENEGSMEMTAHFRFAGSNGTTLVLNKPAKFEVDGQIVNVDSSDFSGAFYKVTFKGRKPFDKHELVFTNIDKKNFVNDFVLENFRLSNVPVAVSKSAPAVINFEAPELKGDDYIELTSDNTDSSFSVRHLAADSGNAIVIPVEQLQRQKGSGFSIIATLYRKLPLQQQTKEGGDIKMTHVTRLVKLVVND